MPRDAVESSKNPSTDSQIEKSPPTKITNRTNITVLCQEVVEALTRLDETNGSTFHAIENRVKKNVQLGKGVRLTKRLQLALDGMVQRGQLVRDRRFYRLRSSDADCTEDRLGGDPMGNGVSSSSPKGEEGKRRPRSLVSYCDTYSDSDQSEDFQTVKKAKRFNERFRRQNLDETMEENVGKWADRTSARLGPIMENTNCYSNNDRNWKDGLSAMIQNDESLMKDVQDKMSVAFENCVSDFEAMFDSYRKGKVSRSVLKRCELMYLCKMCRNIYFSLDQYNRHFYDCNRRFILENLKRIKINLRKEDDVYPMADAECRFDKAERIKNRAEREPNGIYQKCSNQILAETDPQNPKRDLPLKMAKSIYIYNGGKNLPRRTRDEAVDIAKKAFKGKSRNPRWRMSLPYQIVLNEEEERLLDIEEMLCLCCRSKFSTRLSLRVHVATVHLAYKRFKCKYCDFKSAGVTGVKKHFSHFHPSKATYPFKKMAWILSCG